VKPVACSASLAFLLSATIATATDRPIALDTWPSDYVLHMQRLQKALGGDNDPEVARGVYYGGAVWPLSYPELSVCFFGGTPEARGLIAKYAMDWMSAGIAIKFDFGEAGKFRNCGDTPDTEMQIRIGFNDKLGWWSAIGSDSVISIPQDQQTMNLAHFATVTAATWKDEHSLIVRHEFGHALALMHEHQNPSAPCEEEYDWDKLYKVLGEGENGWPKEVTDFNMRRLDPKHFPATAFDKRSIMLYQFPADFYKAGEKAECYSAEVNIAMSTGDLELIRALYPPEESERLARAAQARQEFETLWNKAAPAFKNAVGFDPVAAYFERKGN
jgi:hypothetical protein